jgi:hypothetical protein
LSIAEYTCIDWRRSAAGRSTRGETQTLLNARGASCEMDTDASSVHGRSGIIIVALVVAGMVVLGAGGYLAWSKRHHGQSAGDEEGARWCQIRQEWLKQADPLTADIMLKSVKEEDRGAMELLVSKRNTLAGDFGRRIAGLKIADAELARQIGRVEEALAREGKVRANFAVEIHNAVVKQSDTEDVGAIGKTQVLLRDGIAARMKASREAVDREVAAAVAATGVACPGLYRGPVTDEGTSDSPYISWDELELRRTQALRTVEERMKKLEPVEEYTNRVYHELIAQHRPLLMHCYKAAKAKNPKMSDALGLRVRLKRSGEVKTLAIEWMENQEESLLDCLLEKASKWKLPRPDAKTDVVVVTLDFTKI